MALGGIRLDVIPDAGHQACFVVAQLEGTLVNALIRAGSVDMV